MKQPKANNTLYSPSKFIFVNDLKRRDEQHQVDRETLIMYLPVNICYMDNERNLSGRYPMSKFDSASLEQTAASLERNGFAVHVAENKEKAKELVLMLIPCEAMVGTGDSATVRQIGVIPDLEKRGTKVVNAFIPEIVTAGADKFSVFEETIRQSHHSDIFLTSTNAVTRDGKLVNIDGV